jgi:hypothetical protein
MILLNVSMVFLPTSSLSPVIGLLLSLNISIFCLSTIFFEGGFSLPVLLLNVSMFLLPSHLKVAFL